MTVTKSYAYANGAWAYYTIPAGISSIHVDAKGAGGGGSNGGRGGHTTGTYSVTSGQKIYIRVGGAGGTATTTIDPWAPTIFAGGAGGDNGGGVGGSGIGGGSGGVPPHYGGDGGGGATILRNGSSSGAVITAAAGGGGQSGTGGAGGNGGGATGGAGAIGSEGTSSNDSRSVLPQGGTQTGPGFGGYIWHGQQPYGSGTNGSSSAYDGKGGTGGRGDLSGDQKGGGGGGGGGGGYYSGGGGGGGHTTVSGSMGGGGGSSYLYSGLTGTSSTSDGALAANNGTVTITHNDLNRPPSAPQGLLPANHSGIDPTLAHTFSWTFTDPDTPDHQTAYWLYYRIKGTPAWTMLTGTTAESRSIPANTFVGGYIYEWFVDTADWLGVWGPNSAISEFTTLGQYAPINLSPAGDEPRRVDQTSVFTWTFKDPDVGDTQSKAEIQWRVAGTSTWSSAEQIATTLHTYTAPINKFTSGNRYEYQIRTYDATTPTQNGPWSTSAYFYAVGPPNAPALTGPVGGVTINMSSVRRFGWTFSDPDQASGGMGDSQSSFQLQYRVVGASSWVTMAAKDTPNQYWDAPADTFVLNNYEWQVRTYDSLGFVGPWSSSGFFTAVVPPAGPAITAPTDGETVSGPTYLKWSTPSQDVYQVRKVADDGGTQQPVESTVYFDTGPITSSYMRQHLLDFPTNNRFEHLQIRAQSSGFWSPWSSVRVNVNFKPPVYAVVTATPDNDQALITVHVHNYAPGVISSNLIDNPGFEVDSYGWTGSNQQLDSSEASSGSTSMALQVDGFADTTVDNVDDGSQYSMSFMLKGGAPVITVDAVVGGVPQTLVERTFKTDEYGLWTRATIENLSTPPGTTQLKITIAADGTNLTWFDSVLVAAEAAAPSYFDGDTPSTDSLNYAWVGTPGQSASTRSTNPSDAVDTPTFIKQDLYKIEDGGEPELIAANVLSDTVYQYALPASGVQYQFYTVVYGDNGTIAHGEPSEAAQVDLRQVWLLDPRNPAETRHHYIFNGPGTTEQYTEETAVIYYAGQTLPTVEYGDTVTRAVSVTITALDGDGGAEALRSLIKRKTVVLFRDVKGRKVYGVLDGEQVADTGGMTTHAIVVTATRFEDIDAQ